MVIDPKVEGYWEVTGPKLSFVHKLRLTIGTTYTVFIPDTLIDLNGKKIDKTFSYKFSVKDYDGAAKDKKGRDLAVALLMEDFFNAYLQGEIGRMAGFLDPAFRLESGNDFLSSQQFLDRIRKETTQKSQLNSGFLGPVYRTDAAACSTKVAIRKVASNDKKDTLWVQDHISAGILPKVYRKAETIANGISWSKTENKLSLDGRDFVFDLPPTNAKDNSSDNRYVGEQLRLNSSVVLGEVKDISKDEFSIDGGIAVTDQDAKVAVKLTTITTHGRFNWDLALACSDPAKTDTSYRIIKFILGYTGTKWTIKHGVDGGLVEKQKFTQNVVATDFKVKEIKPITLLGPTNGVDGAGGTTDIVNFRFRGLDFDSVGGYLVGLAEDPKFIGGRASYGGFYFVKNQGKGAEQSFKLGAQGQVISGATSILRDVHTLGLPGWEKTNFKYPISQFYNGDSGIAGVYNCKAIAILDTSAAQFLSNGFSADRFYGESDFGSAKGAFAVGAYPRVSDFTKLDNQVASIKAPSATVESFVDKDLDGFPDFMELNYKTDPNDKASFPNFMIDTDHDGIADFLEILVDPSGVEREASDSEKKAFFIALSEKGVKWIDTDNDSFPDDVEKLLGYNPNDINSHPATHARVSAPSGLFSGLLKLGDKAYPIKFKVRQQVDSLFVTYSAYLKDTLSDTVRGDLNETMGEFLFPIRLPDNGLDSGKSLLLRGTFDKTRGLLIGWINRINSISKSSTHFSGGPFVGQYAASGRSEDVSIYLDLNKPSTSAGPSNPSVSPLVAATQPTVE